jgi:hypothetical protein
VFLQRIEFDQVAVYLHLVDPAVIVAVWDAGAALSEPVIGAMVRYCSAADHVEGCRDDSPATVGVFRAR